MKLSLTLVFCLIGALLIAQHHEVESDHPGADQATLTSEHPHHMIQIMLGHTHIPDGRNGDGEKEFLILASWGLNYNYKFNEKWLIGLHSDMIIEKFEIELEHDMLVAERSRPIAVALMGGYKTRSPFTFLVGGGVEFEKSKNLGFLRFGVEPGWHFGGGKWEVSAVLEYEIKFKEYNSSVIGFAIARLF